LVDDYILQVVGSNVCIAGSTVFGVRGIIEKFVFGLRILGEVYSSVLLCL
jgi:hypothetical protein